MTNFHTLEVVCRGSGTQLQVCEKINDLTWGFTGWHQAVTLIRGAQNITFDPQLSKSIPI